MKPQDVERALVLDTRWTDALRAAWVTVVDVAVFGALASSRIGALPKFRRRVLELGERLASLAADRAWIPQPREQLKNALASARIVREAFEQLDRVAREIDRGADVPELTSRIAALKQLLACELETLERRWATLLEDDRRASRDHDPMPERD
jgi:hypothetical protein